MRKTVPQYTIFTCDCCSREQDDKEHQMSLADGNSTFSFGKALETFQIKWQHPHIVDEAMEMEFCSECALRIHDAIQDVKRRASSEALQESLAIYERALR